MVKIFKPLIVRNVRIHDILPHLSFLDDPEGIYEEMKYHSERDAVLSLLDKLDESKALGKWQKFMDGLNACGYTYIVDNIRGYKFINHHYQTEYLKTLTPKIKNMISPPELMIYLMAKNLLSDTDKENIMSDCDRFGDIHGAITLLGRISKKHRNWYMLFIEALEEAKYDEVAADLRIERLMGNGRVKETRAIRLVGGITADRNEDQVIEPPPIPTRLPIIREQIQAHNVLPDDNSQTPHILYDGQNACEESPTETLANTSNADIDEQSETNIRTSNDYETEQYEPISQFNNLENDISLLKQEESTLGTEISLLVKKTYHYGNVLDHLKKKKQLNYSISLMEKERNALLDEPITCQESYEDQHVADVYYPGSDRSRSLLIRRTGANYFLSKLAVEPQSADLTGDHALSPLPIYSPTFDKTLIRQLQSDKDSGTGTIDVEYEEYEATMSDYDVII